MEQYYNVDDNQHVDPEQKNDSEGSNSSEELYKSDEGQEEPQNDGSYQESQDLAQMDRQYQIDRSDIACSITVGDIRGQNQFQMQRMMMTQSAMRYQSHTVVIDEGKADRKTELGEDEQYFMGVYKWYWSEHGFFSAFWRYFGMKISMNCVYNFFYNVGIAVGAFFFKRLVLSKFDFTGYC